MDLCKSTFKQFKYLDIILFLTVDNEEATVEDVKPEAEEETTHKRHHHHHRRHHHRHHHHKAEEESEGECTDRQNCAAPAHNKYAVRKELRL